MKHHEKRKKSIGYSLIFHKIFYFKHILIFCFYPKSLQIVGATIDKSNYAFIHNTTMLLLFKILQDKNKMEA